MLLYSHAQGNMQEDFWQQNMSDPEKYFMRRMLVFVCLFACFAYLWLGENGSHKDQGGLSKMSAFKDECCKGTLKTSC